MAKAPPSRFFVDRFREHGMKWECPVGTLGARKNFSYPIEPPRALSLIFRRASHRSLMRLPTGRSAVSHVSYALHL
jgi:hypothetical protein